MKLSLHCRPRPSVTVGNLSRLDKRNNLLGKDEVEIFPNIPSRPLTVPQVNTSAVFKFAQQTREYLADVTAAASWESANGPSLPHLEHFREVELGGIASVLVKHGQSRRDNTFHLVVLQGYIWHSLDKTINL